MSKGRISCFMVTGKHRIGLAQRAMLSFSEQTHVDRELFIAVADRAALEQLRQFSLGLNCEIYVVDLKAHELYEGTMLSALKVLRKTITGDWWTMWDDDNLCHPQRLERQLSDCRPDRPCFMSQGVYHFFDTDELFVVDAEKLGGKLPSRVIPYTMMIHRSAWKSWVNPEKTHPLIKLLERMLNKREPVTIIRHEYQWIVVGVRRDNLRGYSTHRAIAVGGSLPGMQLLVPTTRDRIEKALDAYVWPADQLSVCGSDGMSFIYQPIRIWPAGLLPVGDPVDGVVRIVEQ